MDTCPKCKNATKCPECGRQFRITCYVCGYVLDKSKRVLPKWVGSWLTFGSTSYAQAPKCKTCGVVTEGEWRPKDGEV
jgi:hypothetical protein